MYDKNFTFKTEGVDGCNCEEILRLIGQSKITTIIEWTYELFEQIL